MIGGDCGFGRCACGAWAIVKLGGAARCLSCFEVALAGVGEQLSAVRRTLDDIEEHAKRAATP